jgi:hypothetical protein
MNFYFVSICVLYMGTYTLGVVSLSVQFPVLIKIAGRLCCKTTAYLLKYILMIDLFAMWINYLIVKPASAWRIFSTNWSFDAIIFSPYKDV